MTRFIFLVLECLLALSLPLILPKVFAKKLGAKGFRGIWYGVCVYFLFVAVGYTAFSALVSDKISSDAAAAVIDGAVLCLLIFLGRLLWVSAFLKKAPDPAGGWLFGCGHVLPQLWLTYALPAGVNAFFAGAIAFSLPVAVPPVFSSTVSALQAQTGFGVFCEILQMLLMAALEIGNAEIVYEAVRKGRKSLAAGSLLCSAAAYSALRWPGLSHTVTLPILAAAALIVLGLAFCAYTDRALFPKRVKK